MAGELWNGTVQLAKEVTAGTPVSPATRKMYMREPTMSLEREPRFHKFATQTRDNVRGFTLGPKAVGGELSMPLSAAESLELFELGIKGGITPTIPATATTTRLWTYKPGDLASATLEWHDGARAWQAAGVRAESLNIAGNVREENIITAELFGTDMIPLALTPALTDRTPEFYEGWETKFYIDAFGGTPGTTPVPGVLISWDITVTNNLARKYHANNQNSADGVTSGEMEIEATLLFEAAPAATLTEFNNWAGATKRLIRLEFGNNAILEAALKSFVTVDLAGAWSAVDLGQDDEGTRAYELTFGYVYEPTIAAGIQIRAQNSRTTTF